MSFTEIKQKLCANPAYTLTNAATLVGGVAVAAKGVMMTAAAVATAASLASVAVATGVGVTLAGAYVVVSSCKNVKQRILNRQAIELDRDYRHDYSITGILNAVVSVVTFQKLVKL